MKSPASLSGAPAEQRGVVGNDRASEARLLSQVQIPRSVNYNCDDGGDVFLGMLLKLT